MRTSIIVLCGAIALSAHSLRQEVTVVRVRQLWDGDRVIPNASIVIRGSRIIEVGARVSAPPGAREIDLRDLSAVPGLIDLHTHVTYFWDRAPGTTPLRPGRRRTPEDTADAAAVNDRHDPVAQFGRVGRHRQRARQAARDFLRKRWAR